MADITLHTSRDAGVTCISNAFIDEYGSYGYGMDRTFVLSDDGRE